ncbi:MAG TPA: hypothetical protein VKB67_01765, partial [Rhizomicrobium sp.]|nr:hypothetical protein [Rhizomicrobium sp.]
MRAKLSLFALLLGSVLASGAIAVTTTSDDPHAWLEDVHGAKPLDWVREQNARSLAQLKSDPRYQTDYDSVLEVLDATDRIPMGSLRHGHVYNFWQDAQNPKGLWRRTTIADYQAHFPHWDVLLDVDALAKTEGENWVFKGASCSPGETRCLIQLSRGGGDAVAVREYDLKDRKFVTDGFSLPEAKGDMDYLDDDTVLFASALGPQTNSGYARTARLWTRGKAVADSPVIYEGKPEDVLVAPAIFHTKQGNIGLVVRAVSFFESEYYLPGSDGVWWKLPLPRAADMKGVFDNKLIFTLRENWTLPSGVTLTKGSLVGMALDGTLPDKVGRISTLYVPGPRQSIESVGVGRDKIYAAITDNVIGAVHVFTARGSGWTDKILALPGQGTTAVVSVNEFGPEALISFENYLTPPTLYFDDGSDTPKAIKSLPARFDASGMVTEQFEAASKDGTKIPYFVTRPKNLAGPAPTILYGYGGFEVSLTPSYSANFGRLWLSHGGIYVV